MSSARRQRRLAGGPVQRRRQVLQGMADGLTARQVAHRLGISRRTVEGHLRVLRELTGARSIGELCAVSVAEGWVTPGRLAPGVALDGLGARGLVRPVPLRSRPETGRFPDDLIMPGDRPADSRYPPGPVFPAGRDYPVVLGCLAGTTGSAGREDSDQGAAAGSEPSGEPARVAPGRRTASPGRDSTAPDDRTGRRPGGRPTVLTPDRIIAARQLLLEHSVTDTARRLGISRSTLYAHLAEIAETGQQGTPATGSAGPR